MQRSSLLFLVHSKRIQHHHHAPQFTATRRSLGVCALESSSCRFSYYYSTQSSSSDDDDDESRKQNGQDHLNSNNNKNCQVSKAEDDPLHQQQQASILSQLRSPPNILTLSRAACAPFISYLLIQGQPSAALGMCLIAGITDVLDGYVAKRFDMCTVLGTYLDPLADKAVINIVGVTLWHLEVLPTPLVAVWLVKDVLLMGATWHHIQSVMLDKSTTAKVATSAPSIMHHQRDNRDKAAAAQDQQQPQSLPLVRIQPTLMSKINTALQFATLTMGIFVMVAQEEPLGHLWIYLDGCLGDDNSAATIANVSLQTLPGLCWLTGGTTLASAISYVGYNAFQQDSKGRT